MRTLATDNLLSDASGLWLEDPAIAGPTEPDPMSQALPWLVRHLGVAAAVEAVVGPVDGVDGLDVPGSDQILPALRRIGFDARMAQRALADLQASDLPAVLLLRHGEACVLTGRHTDSDGQTLCTVVMPGPQALELQASDDDIAAEYSGVALLVSRPAPPVRVAGRSPFAQTRGQTGGLSALAAAIQSASQAMARADRDEGAASHARTAQAAPARNHSSHLARTMVEPAAMLLGPSTPDTPDTSSAVAQALTALMVDGRADDAVVLELSFLKAAPPAGRARLAAAAWRLRCRHGLDRTLALGVKLKDALASGLRRVAHGLSPLSGPRRAGAPAATSWSWSGLAAPTNWALRATLDPLLARATAGLRQCAVLTGWRAALAPASLGGLPLWLGMCGVCLLIGTPLAWAQMVSASSLQAAATLAPARWRDALAADQERAILALARQQRDMAAAVAERGPVPAATPVPDDLAVEAGPGLTAPAPAMVAVADVTPADEEQGEATVRTSAGRARSTSRRVPRMQ